MIYLKENQNQIKLYYFFKGSFIYLIFYCYYKKIYYYLSFIFVYKYFSFFSKSIFKKLLFAYSPLLFNKILHSVLLYTFCKLKKIFIIIVVKCFAFY